MVGQKNLSTLQVNQIRRNIFDLLQPDEIWRKNMMLQYFQDLESGITARLDEDSESPNPRKKYALEVARLGSRLYSGKYRVAWCGVRCPI
jgi:hypothetical protein